MPKAKYEFQKLVVVKYSQAFKTKSLKIWKTSNFSIKIVTIIFVYYCIFLRFSFYPTQIWNGTISHITRSSILLGKSKIFVSLELAGTSHLCLHRS